MSHLLNDFLYDVPDEIGPNAHLVITKDMVEESLSGLVKNKDLSQYILWRKPDSEDRNPGLIKLL